MIAFEYIYNRRVPLIYTAPAICEFDFSGTGEPTIYLAPIVRAGAPTGLVFGGVGGLTLTWNAIPGALCYSIYRSVDEDNPYGEYTLVAECLAQEYFTVPEGDDHWWVVDVITNTGVSPTSDPAKAPGGSVPTPPAPTCPTETGDPCPEGPVAFDAPVSMGEWFTFCEPTPNPKTMLGPDNAIPWDEYTQEPGNFVFWFDWGGLDLWRWELAGDYPPGEYMFRYVSGMQFFIPSGVPAPNDWEGGIGYFLTIDEEKVNWPVDWLVTGITEVNLDCLSSGETPVGGVGVFQLAADIAGVEAALQGWFRPDASTELFWGDNRFMHSNEGGKISMVHSTAFSAFNNPPVGFYPIIQVMQVNGLRQQARQVRVQGWASLAPFFPLDISSNWNGDFDTRTLYTSNTCRWDAPAADSFGGARVYYSQSRPEAPNGCAWVCEVYVGANLHWQGVKIIGNNPVGLYHRTAISAASPACLRVENKTIWNYPTP